MLLDGVLGTLAVTWLLGALPARSTWSWTLAGDLAFNAVHTPMHATEQDLAGLTGGERRRKLIAMTHALDRAVGTVLDALRQAGALDDTLLFFVNDNGGATNNASRNTPLRGRKGQMFEGGIRVPFAVQWPARLPKGVVRDEPVIALDILPTCLAAAAASPRIDKALDGVDLLPHLTGAVKTPPHDALFWRHGDKWAVRAGRWKLVVEGGAGPQLFDLDADASEKTDLAPAQPDRVAALEARYRDWSEGLVAPRWGF
jgi:arylsulfatase A-like enzyme